MNPFLLKLFTKAVLLGAACAAVLIPIAAKASPINPIVGNFSISGGDAFDANQITFTNPALLLSSTLPGIQGFLNNSTVQTVTMTSFLYANAVGTQLFTFTQNGVVVSFAIYQDTVTYTPHMDATPSAAEVNKALKIDGYGWLNETGYDQTSASFSLTSSESGAISFQVVGNSPAVPSVPSVAPEPSTLTMIGTGMLGIGALLMRRLQTICL